jgi:tripartite motif-containing protein 37
VSSELDKLRKKTQKAQAKELCAVHNAPLYYYCGTCANAVCSDCAMFGDLHKGHKFEHLSVVYQRHVDMVRGEGAALRKRLKELTCMMHQVETNVEAVTKAKEERAVELAAAVEQMQARLDMQLKNKLLTLLSYKGVLVEEIEHQSSMLHELNRQLAFSPKSAFIAKSEGLIASLQALYKKQAGPIPHPVATDFASEVVPPYISASCTLREYSKLRAGGAVYYSNGLETYGQTWRLKVYPNGNGVARSHYLSVFLEMTAYRGIPLNNAGNPQANPAKYDYRIELVNQKFPHVVVTREFASDFEVGECWGYNRFFRIDNLVKDGYLLTDDDVIVLRFYVRPQTYYQHCRDLKAYIAHLETTKNADCFVDTKNDVALLPPDADRTTAAAHREDKSLPDSIAIENNDHNTSTADWWQSRSFPPSPPSPPLMPSTGLLMSSLQSTFAPTHTTTSGPKSEPINIWADRPHTSDRDSPSSHSSSPASSSSAELQDAQLNGDDADQDNTSEDTDIDTASLFDTLSLANYELGSIPRGVYTTHSYPASPYPSWAIDDQDEDDELHEGNENDHGIDRTPGHTEDQDEEEEEGLIR